MDIDHFFVMDCSVFYHLSVVCQNLLQIAVQDLVSQLV